MSVKHIEAVYDSYAGVYDLVFGKFFQSGRERAPVLLKLFPGAKLLEVGVGTGLSLPLCARNVEFTGIDLSQKMLDRARHLLVNEVCMSRSVREPEAIDMLNLILAKASLRMPDPL